jgi:hypothetical protein
MTTPPKIGPYILFDEIATKKFNQKQKVRNIRPQQGIELLSPGATGKSTGCGLSAASNSAKLKVERGL